LSLTIRRKASSFEEYWLASKAWERHGLAAAAARALVHNGFLTLDDVQGAHDLELASLPGVGRRSLTVLLGLLDREAPVTKGSPPPNFAPFCSLSSHGTAEVSLLISPWMK
jgi:hypothetical protein